MSKNQPNDLGALEIGPRLFLGIGIGHDALGIAAKLG